MSEKWEGVLFIYEFKDEPGINNLTRTVVTNVIYGNQNT